MTVGLLTFDTGAALVLLATALGGAYLPVVLGKKGTATGQRSLSYILGNMLSAGVMISAGFVHLLGDSIKQLVASYEYPIAPFLCACGYLFTLIADQTVEGITGLGHGHVAHQADGDVLLAQVMVGVSAPAPGVVVVPADASPRHTTTERMPVITRLQNGGDHPSGSEEDWDPEEGGLRGVRRPGAIKLQRVHSSGSGGGGGAADQRGPDCDDPPGSADGGGEGGDLVPSSAHRRQQANGKSRLGAASRDKGCHSMATLLGASVLRSDDEFWREEGESGGSPRRAHAAGEADAEPLQLAQAMREHAAHGHGHSNGRPKRRQVSFLTAVLMAVALCFHSLLEGAALGSQPDVTQSLHIFIAIQAHKGLAAYALGSSIVDSGADMRQYWSVIAFFSLATPLGIFLGYGLSAVTTENGAACISALASGTFLYVAMMEVIPKELEDPRHRLIKLLFLGAGFGLMSLLAIWA